MTLQWLVLVLSDFSKQFVFALLESKSFPRVITTVA